MGSIANHFCLLLLRYPTERTPQFTPKVPIPSQEKRIAARSRNKPLEILVFHASKLGFSGRLAETLARFVLRRVEDLQVLAATATYTTRMCSGQDSTKYKIGPIAIAEHIPQLVRR